MNKFLFATIGVLFVGAIGVGVFIFTQNKASVQNAEWSAQNTIVPAATTTTEATPTPSSSPTSPTTSQAPGTFTLVQIATHNSSTSCYTTVNGVVYDVTPWIQKHPGGAKAILSMCGKDGSAAFNGQHGGQRKPEQELATFKIGVLIP